MGRGLLQGGGRGGAKSAVWGIAYFYYGYEVVE